MILAKRTRAVESEMKMQLFVSCLVLISVVLDCGLAASASTVGLYAPDRYDGIPETCLLPMDFGYCRAKVKRYYFDMRRMKCAMFYFGGCAGNVNNFKSLEECNRVCLDGYGDYDSPNDVVAVNKASGRDYRGRGSVNSNSNKNNSNAGSSSSSRGVSSNVGGIKNNTSTTSYGGSIAALDASYKNSYSKYNSNTYNTNTNIDSNVNGNNSGSAVNNNTKIIRNRSDDNLDEYDYEEN
uniref:Toxin APEKTx1 n=1 Tax=Bactrocera latifrons TaxID=174628 RepID=A0A0K8UCW1_BACLA